MGPGGAETSVNSVSNKRRKTKTQGCLLTSTGAPRSAHLGVYTSTQRMDELINECIFKTRVSWGKAEREILLVYTYSVE